MPAEDQGDVFLRHRGAVLDALLSDPSFGEDGPAGPVASGPLVGEPGLGAVGDPPSVPVVTGLPVDSIPVEAPPPRRSSDGPKASERIIALLNGQQQPASTPAMDFSSDFSEVAAKQPPPDEPMPSAAGSGRSSKPRGTEAADRIVVLAKKLKNPKVALAVCAVLAVLLILALVSTGSKDEKPAVDRIAVITPSATAAPTTKPEAAPAASGTIQVKSATAHCPPGSTPGMDAFGGQQGKAWSCVRAYKVDGQVLNIDLGKTYQIDSIGIVPGWDSVGTDGIDQWTKFRTASRVSYQFDDPNKTTYTQQTLDQRTLVVTKFEVPVQASKVVMTVLESKGDPTINTTAISSIVITGH
ncbi:discoidin domain-containing protein [Nocardia sp. NBC_00565]|uniref:discoidin domain-containing protein n=1 Tax=Nocardia sp. NBC_00565 TaxID=2975993 RepID=UPI002E7FCAB7|nr:discoidin domain-containing protein [Nocardia sp. NBC_00565]WUC07658.1 discoidin domain-containing protein [Nocardia sp. NBC_00565]